MPQKLVVPDEDSDRDSQANRKETCMHCPDALVVQGFLGSFSGGLRNEVLSSAVGTFQDAIVDQFHHHIVDKTKGGAPSMN